jgi:hypothetical protein
MLKKKNVYIKLAEAVSMRCEENLRGRSNAVLVFKDGATPNKLIDICCC